MSHKISIFMCLAVKFGGRSLDMGSAIAFAICVMIFIECVDIVNLEHIISI